MLKTTKLFFKTIGWKNVEQGLQLDSTITSIVLDSIECWIIFLDSIYIEFGVYARAGSWFLVIIFWMLSAIHRKHSATEHNCTHVNSHRYNE